VVVVDNVYVLPGLPRLFRRKFKAIQERFQDTPYHLCEVYVSRYETEIAGLLAQVVARFPEVLVGSYPRPGDETYAVKLTFEGKHKEQVEGALEALLGELPPEWLLMVERPSSPD
jgi:molybdopterin-biosynthesis enzyme MoeA-like protein